LILLACVFASTICLAEVPGLTLPDKHVEYMKDETYKFNYEAFTDVMDQIKGYCGDDKEEYAAFVRQVDGRIAEILKSADDEKEEHEWSGQKVELAAWSYAWGLLADELNLTVIPAEKLKRSAKGTQGYWELKDETREGYMLVENTGSDALNTHYVVFRIAMKGPLATSGCADGYFSGYGDLKDGKLSAEYEYETNVEVLTPDLLTILVEFDGEAARVSTSDAFKQGVLGNCVVYDGNYVRIRKD
jgi:hypothetical protein